MIERDERPLAEIQFALDLPPGHLLTREEGAAENRRIFALVGVEVAQDIVDLGCTGLVAGLQKVPPYLAADLVVLEARRVRERMSGSICGLPCYVPPDRFCLVHNIPGALQLQGNMDGPQALRHPEGIPLCSRPLTTEERAAQAQIHGKLMADAAVAAQDMGAEITEQVSGVAPATNPLADTSKTPSTSGSSAFGALAESERFKCVEHFEFEPACRFCLAQAVTEGPLEPTTMTFVSQGLLPRESAAFEQAFKGNADEVELYVRAARWTRKLTRE